MKNTKNLKSIIISAVIFVMMVACFAGIGIIEVSAANDVAKIGEVSYTSFADAFSVAQSGETVVALSDSDEAFDIKTGVMFDGGEFTFSGNVRNFGTILGGNFTNPITSTGNIDNGTFEGRVTTMAGTIYGGTFNGGLSGSATISGGIFTVKLESLMGNVNGGTFNCDVSLAGNGQTVTKAMFNGSVYVGAGTTIINANEGDIVLGENFQLSKLEGTINCTAHFGGEASCTEQAKCTLCGEGYGEMSTHTNENGICTACGFYQPAVFNEDGYYEIANAGQLFWFANYINTVDRTASAKLTADIDLENRPWTPIGSTGETNNNFRGHFDGQNHTVKGLYVEGGRAGLGFFGEVRLGTVENFTIYGEVKLIGKFDYVGGVIGSAPGASSDVPDHNGATIRNITSYVNVTLGEGSHGSNRVGGFIGYANHETLIENCTWYGTLDLDIYRAQDGVGGLLGKANDNSAVTIRNCAAYGTIRTAYKSGSYVGPSNNTPFDTIFIGGIISNSVASAQTVIENTIWAGTIIDETDLGNNAHISAFGSLNGIGSVTNCYALAGSVPYITTNNTNADNISVVSYKHLISGEVAYLLGSAWGQKLGENGDAYPVLGGATVYKNIIAGCTEDSYVYEYSNTKKSALKLHTAPDENGECENCGNIIVARIDDVYDISLEEAFTAAQSGETVVALADSNEELEIPEGVIFEGGEFTFSGDVDNYGTISGGKFSGTVYNYDTLESGEFSNYVYNNGTIYGGEFTFSYDIYNDGTISGGKVNCGIYNNGTIYGGEFSGTVTNHGTISGGTFNGSLKNYGKIANKADDEYTLVFGENLSYTAENGSKVECEVHFGCEETLICSLCEATVVARIDDVYYISFEEAFTEAQSGETVVALAGSDEKLEIPEGVIFDGGEFTFSYEVKNYGTISSGKFSGTVDNYNTVESGEFSCYVYNNGTIYGGEFTYSYDITNHGTISGGKFNCGIYNEGTISGGEFSGTVTNYGTISGGTFNDEVNNRDAISGGTFSGNVNNNSNIYGGVFNGELINYFKIINKTDDEYTLVFGENLSYTAEEGSRVECEAHFGGEATCTEPAKCTLCGEGYGEALGHSALDENGECENCGNIIVARIGDVYYISFEEAFAAAQSGETVVALAGSDEWFEVPAGVTFDGGAFAFLTIDNYGTISGGTFEGVANNGTINGGEFSISVANNGTINGGEFNSTVNNRGTISGGEFNSTVSNYGTINGGTFSGGVYNYVTIEDGEFRGNILNSGTINGGKFSVSGNVINYDNGAINGGTFIVSDIIDNSGTISGGEFTFDTFYNSGTISSGMFDGEFINYGSIINVSGDEYTLVFGENLSYTAEEGASITCDDHFGGEATCTDTAKCMLCGEGYGEALGHTAPDENGECENCGNSIVARIGDVYYASFDDAFKAAQSGEPVVALAGSDLALEVPEGVTFNGGEFTFGGTIYNYGTISGGTFSGFVHNMGSAEVNGGAFTYVFYNDGTISGGNFTCGLTNDGTISGGTFSGHVYNEGTISGGNFTGSLTNEGTISGGNFTCSLTNEGTISDGEFSEIVENDGTVYGGTFNDSVYNKGTVYGGVLGGKLKNYSSVINVSSDEYTLVFGENFSYKAEKGASITCDDHFGGEATCTDTAKCTLCGEGYGEVLDHIDTDKDNKCDKCGNGDSSTTTPTQTTTGTTAPTQTTTGTTTPTQTTTGTTAPTQTTTGTTTPTQTTTGTTVPIQTTTGTTVPTQTTTGTTAPTQATTGTTVPTQTTTGTTVPTQTTTGTTTSAQTTVPTQSTGSASGTMQSTTATTSPDMPKEPVDTGCDGCSGAAKGSEPILFGGAIIAILGASAGGKYLGKKRKSE